MAKKRRRTQKPGEKPSGPGPYKEIGPRKGDVPNPREIEITPDDGHMPPTQKPKRKWKPQPKKK